MGKRRIELAPGTHERRSTQADIRSRHPGLIQRRAKAEAGCPDGMKAPQIVGRDPPDGDEHGTFGEHSAPCFEHGWTELLGGEQLQHIGAMGERRKSLRGRCDARRTREIGCLGGLHDRGIGVRHDDEPAARESDLLNLLWRHDRPGPDQTGTLEVRAKRGDAVEGLWRVQRDLDDAEAGRHQGATDRDCLRRCEAAQDRDQRHLGEVVLDHGSISWLLEALFSHEAGCKGDPPEPRDRGVRDSAHVRHAEQLQGHLMRHSPD